MQGSDSLQSTDPASGRPSTSQYVEFKLRSTCSTNYLHNIMTLAGPPVSMSDFTTPVRLVRDPSALEAESDIDPSSTMITENNGGRRKRKTRLVQPEEEDEFYASEKVPWLLEDFDGQHSYVSSLIVPESRYVIFVNQGNEFRVLQASKWYKFSPKLSYVPLTLEEAEERMASKGRNEEFDRWLMRKRTCSNESSGTASVRANPTAQSNNLKVATRLVNLEEEGFDFDEYVDDDDGEDLYRNSGAADEDDPSMPKMGRPRIKKNLTDAGKQVKRLMKNLDKNSYFYESDEEDVDPYAEDNNLEDEAMQVDEPHKILQKPTEVSKSKPALQPQKSTESLVNQPALARSRSPGLSTTGSTAGTSSRPRSRSPSIKATMGEASSLTEGDIISILREGPIKTKDLIGRVKGKLRADPQNKEIFREIVRRVASVRPTVSQDEDKLLELRTEFR